MAKIAFLTRADNNNLKYYDMFANSLRKFHGPDEVDLLLWNEDKIIAYNDPAWFYRASPTILLETIDRYELCLAVDVDQIVMGNLDHIFNGDYDIGTVLNVNRYDPSRYGFVQFQGINPNEYYNNGLVAVRNNTKGKEFLTEWNRLCHTKYFHRLQYREQDLLNVLAHYGNYYVKCFDDYDVPNNEFCWNGLVAKNEVINSYLDDFNNIIIPRGKDNYPDRDVTLKAYHWAGGTDEKKMNYRTVFPEKVIHYIDWLVRDTQKPYVKNAI